MSDGKILLVCQSQPPILNGAACVVDQLSRQFGPEEMILAGEAAGPWRQYQRHPALPPIERVTHEWTWPRRGKRYLHWLRRMLKRRTAARLASLVQTHRCKSMVVVYPDEYYLHAGYLAAMNTGIKFYPYFHNTYAAQRPGASRARRLEQQAIRAADAVFVMSEGLQRVFQQQYPGIRFVPLLHSFDGPLPEAIDVPPVGNSLSLGFLGNVNHSNLEAMTRLAAVIRAVPDVRLTIYCGHTPRWFLESQGYASDNIELGTAALGQEVDALRQHDALLLPHGLSGRLAPIEYETIFPTRLIPYLLAGRPILAHTPERCFLTDWLREHDCAEVVSQPSEEQLRQALSRLRSDQRRQQLVENGFNAVQPFYGRTVAEVLRRHVNELCGADGMVTT